LVKGGEGLHRHLHVNALGRSDSYMYLSGTRLHVILPGV